MRQAGLDPRRVLQVGAGVVFRQIFEFGLFQADPSPGNLLLLPGNRVALLDFGTFGRLSPRERRRIGLALWALINSDYEAVADQLLHLSTWRTGADLRGFQETTGDIVEEWYGQPALQYSMVRLLMQELGAGTAYGVVFPQQLMLLARALVTMESTLTLIDPHASMAELAEPILDDLRRVLQPSMRQLSQVWKKTKLDWLALALEIPESLPHLLAGLNLGDHDAPPPTPPSIRRSRLQTAGLAAAGLGAGLAAAYVVLAPRRRRRA